MSAFSADCRISAARTGPLSDTIESLERNSAAKADPCEDNRAAAAAYEAAVSAEEERLAAKTKLTQLIRQLASAELKREQGRLRQAASELSAAEQTALAQEGQKSLFCARGFFQRDCLGPFERLVEGIESMKEAQEQHLKFLTTKAKELEAGVKNCASVK